ncbi:MAG: DUF883 domain-containing protein [Undibacterium sp.]|nr:DUF883 domain-containing protein [Undibacterium sp.]
MSNLNNLNKDAKALVKDAQALFLAATELSGDKADELRRRGMQSLDSVLMSVHEMSDTAVARSKEMAACTDEYVKENPWRVIAGVAGVGLLLGYVLSRKSAP